MWLKLILGAIAAIAPIAFILWRKYGSADAEIRALRNKRATARKKMRLALRHGQYDGYDYWDGQRRLLTKEIARLYKQKGKRRFFGL